MKIKKHINDKAYIAMKKFLMTSFEKEKSNQSSYIDF